MSAFVVDYENVNLKGIISGLDHLIFVEDNNARHHLAENCRKRYLWLIQLRTIQRKDRCIPWKRKLPNHYFNY